MPDPAVETFDYVVIGSGAGGAPLAANLAEAGYTVLVLEAGFDPIEDHGPETRAHTEVPALHGQASIDRNIRWDFYVEHFSAQRNVPPDSKRVEGKGILYPRASAVGGCTSHHALITLYPHNSDWERIRELTGDDSWSADNMRGYFEQRGHDFHVQKWLRTSFADPRVALRDRQLLKLLLVSSLYAAMDATHGAGGQPANFDRAVLVAGRVLGFLTTVQELVAPRLFERFGRLIADLGVALAAYQAARLDPGRRQALFQSALNSVFEDLLDVIQSQRDVQNVVADLFMAHDPNASDFVRQNLPGIYATPIAVHEGKRRGPRERLLAVAQRSPRLLRVCKGAFVTRLLFDQPVTPTAASRVVAVEYYITDREHPIYRAAPGTESSSLPAGGRRIVNVRREAILCAGTFNTPQLLMLSGIGPRAHLASRNIQTMVPLEGVGANLQDRYEITIVSEFPEDFRVLNPACDFASPAGACYERWRDHHDGIYASNGVTLAIVKKSRQAAPEAPPDLFIFGIPGDFHGYYPDYANDLVRHDAGFRNRRHFTWAILKGHTRNRTGTVQLRSANPLETPLINFNNFGDQVDPSRNPDLLALQEAFEFVRSMNQQMAASHVTEVRQPASLVNPNNLTLPIPQSAQQIRDHILKEAWGHHACGTCKMGVSTDPLAVVDSNFKVFGTRNLRVVDASIFPEIPGFFIVLPIYMISEKASQAILAAAAASGALGAAATMPPAN